ncbi:MAG: domain S-box protein [Bacteroidota bacterium]|nr:domain S-box protein [Bacteroidota bacterium]
MALKDSEETLIASYVGSNDAIMLLNEKGFFDCNPKTLEMFGFNSKEDFTKIHPAEVSPLTQPDGRDSMEAAGEKIRIAYEQGFNRFEWVHRKSTGEDFPAEVLLSAFDFGGEKVLQATVRDITERKRAEQLIQARMKMLDYAATHTLDELLQKALDIVCELTDSPIGFYHFVNEDQKTLHLAAWSTRTVKEFCTAEGRGTHYSIDKAGVWVDCILERRPVIHNDYASLPHRKGLPEGHAPVIRELVVPIIRNELTVAVLGIGNRQIDYTEQDIQVVSYLADVAWEITVRKRAEEALRASQERLSTITNSAMDGIVMMNNEGNISFWNPAAKEIFGYTREEALGKNLHKLIAPESYHPSHLEAFPIWQQSGEGNAVGKTLELSALRKNGEEFPVELSLSSVKQHDSWLAVGIIRDITERKKAERTISDQNKFLLNVIESLKYPFYVVNAEDYSIVLANSTSLEGKSKEREAYCYSLIHNFDNSCGSDVHTCPLTEIKMTMKPVILEDIHIDKNGNEINVEVHGYPITNDDGELIQIIEYVIDITERKKTERLIRERTIELENIIKNRDQMFKIIAHDLRSPFNGLLGFSNILVDEFDTLPKEEIQEYTIMNHTLIKNIYNLLENLLSWVLIQQDRIVIKKADVNINMALTKLIDVYKGNTDKKNITVDLKISDNINIFTDSNLLFTVFRNLISNAIKFTPDNGKITVSAKEENSQVFFSVSDTGVGIPENLKEKIMQPGELFSTQGTASEKGSGLGLMLCKEYIEKLGGRIWFESEEGKGTTFYFSLPIS